MRSTPCSRRRSARRRRALVARRHDRARPRPEHGGRPHARVLPRRAARQPRLRRDWLGRAGALRRRARSRSPDELARAGREDSRGCARGRPAARATACSAGTAARATRCTSTSARPTPRRAWRAAGALGLVGHTHVARRVARRTPRRARATDPRRAARPRRGKWLLNPGAVGAPAPSRARLVARARRPGRRRRFWLLLDLDAQTATWLSAPYDPAPALRASASSGSTMVRVPGMSTQVVVARLAGLTGRAAELRQLLAGRAADVRVEDGCAGYEVAELLGEPAAFLIVQTWTSSEAMPRTYSPRPTPPTSTRSTNCSRTPPKSCCTRSPRRRARAPARHRPTLGGLADHERGRNAGCVTCLDSLRGRRLDRCPCTRSGC